MKKKCNQLIFFFCVRPSPFFFHLALDAFPDIGLVSWIAKKETKKKKKTRSLRIEGHGTPGEHEKLTLAHIWIHKIHNIL